MEGYQGEMVVAGVIVRVEGDHFQPEVLGVWK
jgi:hypothetical protein